MKNGGRMLLLFIVHFSLFVFRSVYAAQTAEIDVAREALRDGLWEVARVHARKAEGDLAKIVVLESYAREDRWSDVLATVEAYGKTEVPDFVYYKAAALYHVDRPEAARKLLEKVDFSRGAYAADATLLHAAALRREGKVDEALARLAEAGDDVDAKMVSAAILKAKGDESGAAGVWREVIAMTNASETSVAIAAANVSDVEALRRIFTGSTDPALARFAGLRLGVLLVRDDATFAEGAGIIRRIVKDTPDFRGARGALLSLADARLSRGDFAASADSYREAMETWPECSKEPSVRLGLGWAYSELGRNEESLTEFATVLSLAAADDEMRALALVKSGDVLSAMGKRDESLARYREALEKYPHSAAAKKISETVAVRELEQKGRDAFAAYRFDEARAIFEEVAGRDASAASRMEYYDMVCLYGLGRDSEAERKAQTLAATSRDAYVREDASLWLAKFLYNRGRYREAESNFTACAGFSVNGRSSAESLLWATRSAFAAGDFQRAIQHATKLDSVSPGSRSAAEGMLIQSEALIELARFDEAVLVSERVVISESSDAALRLRAQLLRADALFAMGADNPVRYREALEAYTALRSGEKLSPSVRLRLSYKLAKTLERLKRMDEAIDEYYTRVVLAFRNGRSEGQRYDEDAVVAFSRAAFRLAEEYESRGSDYQAVSVLRLVVTAQVPASAEAENRIERIHRKGKIL